MNKQLLWGMLLLLAGFSSCKKNDAKPAEASAGTKDKLKVNVVQPTYYYADLTLQARQPGETFDTYKCVWSGEEVKVTGTPSWSTASYPSLVNGIPALGAGYGVYNNADNISSSVAGGQDFIILSIGTKSLTSLTTIQTNLDKYNSAVSSWNGGAYPSPSDYVKPSYTDSGTGILTVTGKLIRVTTGSHWAIATVNYPTPTPANAPHASFIGTIQILVNGTLVNYDLSGKNGIVTQIVPWTPATVPTPTVTGTYTTTSSDVVFNVDVIVTLPNGGGQVPYKGTADAS